MGVWIEIVFFILLLLNFNVTPCVGVWIEIEELQYDSDDNMSLPAWECGLKYRHLPDRFGQTGHSLRGSVD